MAAQRIERGDLWKNNARLLQLRLRDLFRVTVDKHRRRHPMFSDASFASTFQRCLTRFRDFRRDSLPSSSVFYRRRVSKDFKGDEDSVLTRMLQSVAIPLVGNMCYVFMHGLNRVQVYGGEKLHEALLHRAKNKSLLTVSNHVASVDDPFVIASLLPREVLMDAQKMKWTLCASDRCFKNPVTTGFFRSVKVLPVVRGDGIYQKGMDMAIAKLNSGGWVHIFPEGSRSRDGGKTLGSPKRGVGRLILDADSVPMVIPFVHIGMHEIMPIGANIPRIGKTVTVLVGEPIQFDDLLSVEGVEDMSRGKLYDAVATRIGHRLQELKAQVEKIAFEQSIKLQNHITGGMERAADMLQQVDWDYSLGIGTHHVLTEDDSSGYRIQTTSTALHQQKSPSSSDRHFRMGLAYEGTTMVSRIRAYMDSTDQLLGFAARGLFMNHNSKEKTCRVRDIGPLRAWKLYLEANLVQYWNYN